VNVSYDERALTIDGRRTLLLSGAIHYPRSTPEMWPDLMRRSRDAGLNAIETYVFWNLHERVRGTYDFSGRLDLERFCRCAEEHGLHVVLRIGPYICAETNYGGLPAWLRDVPGMLIRTENEPFMYEMGRFVTDLCERIDPLFASRGGPIILAQIENEYELVRKSYGEDGERYLRWALQLGRSFELEIPWVMCKGSVPGALETVNWFYGHELLPDHRAQHPDQPGLWTENWTGWYDTWGTPHKTRTPENLAYAVLRFLAEGGTGINYYMWHGGTNFGREAMYLQTTSYDYDAPLDEHGLETTKARHLGSLHRALAPHVEALLESDRSELEALPDGRVVARYAALEIVCDDVAERAQLVVGGEVVFDSGEIARADRVTRSMRSLGRLGPWTSAREPLPADRTDPPLVCAQPVEQLALTRDEQDECWYSFALDAAGPGELELSRIADIAYVYLDGRLVASTPHPPGEERGDLDSDAVSQVFALDAAPGTHRLDVLCCAIGLIKGDWQIGRRNMVFEKKGLWGPVRFDGRELGEVAIRPGLVGSATTTGAVDPGNLRWHRTTFARPAAADGLALDLIAMTKGQAWLNGRSLGRYWLCPGSGESSTFIKGSRAVNAAASGEPTQRYWHVPLEWLEDDNELVLFEEVAGDPSGVALCAWRSEQAIS
jgi:beta-galactosidase